MPGIVDADAVMTDGEIAAAEFGRQQEREAIVAYLRFKEQARIADEVKFGAHHEQNVRDWYLTREAITKAEADLKVLKDKLNAIELAEIKEGR